MTTLAPSAPLLPATGYVMLAADTVTDPQRSSTPVKANSVASCRIVGRPSRRQS